MSLEEVTDMYLVALLGGLWLVVCLLLHVLWLQVIVRVGRDP